VLDPSSTEASEAQDTATAAIASAKRTFFIFLFCF